MNTEDSEYYHFKIKKSDYDTIIKPMLEKEDITPQEFIEKIYDIFWSTIMAEFTADRLSFKEPFDMKLIIAIFLKTIDRIRNNGKKDKRAIIPEILEGTHTLEELIDDIITGLVIYKDAKKITENNRKEFILEGDRLFQEYMQKNLSAKYIKKFKPNRKHIILGHIIASFELFKTTSLLEKNSDFAGFVSPSLTK